MTETLTQAQLRDWLEHFAVSVEAQQEHLDALDATTGDGEHGSNLSRGVQSIRLVLAADEFPDVQAFLYEVGMAVVNSVGGASGALYGTLFLRLSDVGEGRDELDLAALTEGLASASAGISELGRSKPGDKTLLDALHPAVASLQDNEPSTALDVALSRAAQAAEDGRDATMDMLARAGRGTYVGDRSLGHIDAGATSMAQLIRSLHTVVAGPVEVDAVR